MTDKSTIESALKRGVVDLIVEEELRSLMQKGSPLRVKMGFDPSAPDIHLGHVVGLRKLRQFQEMGHKVVLIVGDWTARIGDPSGQSVTRPVLTAAEVEANAETYLAQFFKVVAREDTEVRWQSEWFNDFGLPDIVNLTNRFTVAQFLAREDFSERFKNQRPIAITEFLYPLLQAYDSVAVESDVEFGGTDQKFNLLVGRDLQGMVGQRPQQCLLVPILPGTDGVSKMSKSLGNYIGVEDSPNDMYGKIMSLPDGLIVTYFELLTDVSDIEIADISTVIKASNSNPMHFKKRLARTLVSTFHNDVEAQGAESHFELTVQDGKAPHDMPNILLPTTKASVGKRLSSLLVEIGMAASGSEAKRLIEQRAVSLESRILETNVAVDTLSSGVLKVGKRQYIRLIESQEASPID
jgi:tyrosyl-tRNA synthetase